MYETTMRAKRRGHGLVFRGLLLAWPVCLVVAASACTGGDGQVQDAGRPPADGGRLGDGARPADGAARDAGSCTQAPALEIVESSQKVCQLTGDDDRQLGSKTINQTATRYHLAGTDLGASFEHQGKLFFLFGDTFPMPDGGVRHPVCGDSIAVSTDSDAADCVSLSFLTMDGHPDHYRSPAFAGWDNGCFSVPLDGVSSGRSMYVWFSIGHPRPNQAATADKMIGSVLARSDDDAASFRLLYQLEEPTTPTASRRFVNVSAEIVPAARSQGLPPGQGDRVVLFGSGAYRASHVYLATVPLAEIEDPTAIRYYSSTDPCHPTWSADKTDATPLFADEKPTVGELSAHWNESLGAWLLLTSGGRVRAARQPWGPWSMGQSFFNALRDGYCKFIYRPDGGCDQLSDPGREDEPGGLYGPYVMARYGGTAPGGAAILSFVLSTWNPYNTMLMRGTLRLASY